MVLKTSATRVQSESLATQNKFSGKLIKNEDTSNKELAEESHKTNTRTFKKSKVHSYLC